MARFADRAIKTALDVAVNQAQNYVCFNLTYNLQMRSVKVEMTAI